MMGLFVCFYNYSRPIIENKTYTCNRSIKLNRYSKYFNLRPHLEFEYRTILPYIKEKTTVGLLMDDWEYPLFYNSYWDKIQLKGIEIYNNTNRLPETIGEVNIIISDKKNLSYIDYNQQRYFNMTSKNKYIWCYQKQ